MSPSTFQSLFDALQHSLTLRETYLLTFFMQYYLHTYIYTLYISSSKVALYSRDWSEIIWLLENFTF